MSLVDPKFDAEAIIITFEANYTSNDGQQSIDGIEKT
jgi:hypothetical protein